MSIFSSLFGWLGWDGDDLFNSDAETTTSLHEDSCLGVNPATGLPMLGCSGLDVGGSPFGLDLHHHETCWSGDSGPSMDPNIGSPFPSWDE